MNAIKPVAWRRAWSFGGPKPEKVKNKDGRLVWPSAWKFNDVTITKLDDRDIALYDEGSVKNIIAEIEGLKKDAERWMHARKLLTVDDISKRQRELEAWQNLVSEEECKRADKAIDAAMKEQAE